MLGVTVFGIFLTPVFYYVLQWFGTQARDETHPADERDPVVRLDE